MNRKLKAWRKVAQCMILRALYTPFKLLPIRNNRVLFSAYLEKQYSCNPRYISEELKKQYGDDIEICWAFRHPESFEYLKGEGITVLPSKGFEFLKHALTSRVIVTNAYYKPSLPRRKNQYFIRTWHGGGSYKRVGADMKLSYPEKRFNAMQQEGADLYLSSSKRFTEETIRSAFGYKGEVLECGMPRNDMLINGDEQRAQAVRERIGLKPGEKLILHAPTYRDDANVHHNGPDYDRLTKALENRFGGKWRMGYRSHHVTMYIDKGCEGAINLTDYPDMQELLLIADALMTDYSSSIWDYSFTGRPGFLYCPDLASYKRERDFYSDISTWPYEHYEDEESLLAGIAAYDEVKAEERIKRHHGALASCESGEASKQTAARIAEICLGRKTK